MVTRLVTSGHPINQRRVHHFSKGHIVDTPCVGLPVGGRNGGILLIPETVSLGIKPFSHYGDVRYFIIHILCSTIALERSAHFTVDGMIDGPYSRTLVQALVSHQVLVLSPHTFVLHPQSFIDSLVDAVGLSLIMGCFLGHSQSFGQACSHAVGTIVESGRVSGRTTIIIKSITCPNTTIGIVETVTIGVEVTLFPSQVALNDRPNLTHILPIARPIEVPQEFIHVVEVHVVMVHLIVTVRIAADVSVAIHLRTPLLDRTGKIES